MPRHSRDANARWTSRLAALRCKKNANMPGNSIGASAVGRADDLLATVEAVHAAGLDAELWPQALAAMTRMIGGVGTTLEVIDRGTLAHHEFHAFGIAPAG